MKRFRKQGNKLIAGICIFGMFISLLLSENIVKAASEWSEWADSKPSIEEKYDLETRTVYRYRDKSTTESSNSTLTGWTQYDSETTWGSWSGWQDTAVASSSTRQVNTRKMYRYRDKSTTTSNSSSLSGWTKYDSSTTWGNWSGWQDAAVSSSSTRKVETRQVQVTAAYTQYRYGRWKSNSWAHFCPTLSQSQGHPGPYWKDYTPWLNYSISGVEENGRCNCGCYNQKANPNQRKFMYNGVKYWWQETQTIPATYKTQYRYKDAKTTYYYYKWSNWSSWSTTQPSSMSTREIQKKTQYQYRDSSTTYYFYKWGEWTDWDTVKPSSSSNREIENKPQYRYKIVEQPTIEQPTTEQQKVVVGNVTVVPVDTKTDEKPAVDDKVKNKNGSKKVKKGDVWESAAGGYKGIYKITDVKKRTVQYKAPKNKKASSVEVPTEIKINKKKYKVTSIAANAFRNNKKLKKVTIGANVRTIGKNAFRGCKKLKKVTIGKNVTTIGSYAFYSCKKLNLIEIKSGKLKKIGKAAFKKIAKHPTARVPKGKIQKYQKVFKGKM